MSIQNNNSSSLRKRNVKTGSLLFSYFVITSKIGSFYQLLTAASTGYLCQFSRNDGAQNCAAISGYLILKLGRFILKQYIITFLLAIKKDFSKNDSKGVTNNVTFLIAKVWIYEGRHI